MQFVDFGSHSFRIATTTISIVIAFAGGANAQITSDGTTNTIVNLEDNIAAIKGGLQAGTNLFHSFQQFSLLNDSAVYFDNGLEIENIFSRVTGGLTSEIDGLIQTQGSANLFLLNPAGIIFGANAQLDIGGSF